MCSSILSQCRDLSKGVTCSVLWFQLQYEQWNFAVTGDEMFVFAVSLDKESYNSLI